MLSLSTEHVASERQARQNAGWFFPEQHARASDDVRARAKWPHGRWWVTVCDHVLELVLKSERPSNGLPSNIGAGYATYCYAGRVYNGLAAKVLKVRLKNAEKT